MHLIDDSWIPVHRDGKQSIDYIAPWQLTENHATEPVLNLAAPRPDFNGALAQFLIGLLQTARPIDRKQWRRWWKTPPTPDELREWLALLHDAFYFEGSGPCFMHDLELTDGEQRPIVSLFIDAPGEKTLKDNGDFFIKRGGIEGLSPAAAAMALLTLQINAPSGGQGHRTSLRGGGPLTTLVLYDPGPDQPPPTLWQNLWLNVLTTELLHECVPANKEKVATGDRFPWTATTRTSEGGKGTTPEDVHPDQVFWAMPRRIRLNEAEKESGHCDLLGIPTDARITGYQTRNFGFNYVGPWRHPLSPYYKDKQGMLFPQHPQPGGMNYRHWMGLAMGTECAYVVNAFYERHGLLSDSGAMSEYDSCRLWAFGYDMDNMKARCWYESVMPLYAIPEDEREVFKGTVEKLVNAAELGIYYLTSAVKQAWSGRPKDLRGSTALGVINAIEGAFWQNTEHDFYNCLGDLAHALRTDADAEEAATHIRIGWHKILCRKVNALFDQWAAQGGVDTAYFHRVARAYNDLQKNLYGKKLRITVLELPQKKEKTSHVPV